MDRHMEDRKERAYMDLEPSEFFDYMTGRRKDFVIIGKICDIEVDGPWKDPGRKMHAKLDRKYYQVRVQDALLKSKCGQSFNYKMFPITDKKYLVLVALKEGTRKYETLTDFGFKRMKRVS